METAVAKGRQRSQDMKSKTRTGERGFTLIEAAIALVILMFATFGVAALFVFATNYNRGAHDRALALAVAQQQMERLRKTSFATLATPAQPEADIVMAGKSYGIVTTVDGSSTLKRITIQVTPKSAGSSWALRPVTVVTLRSTTSIGTNFPSAP